MHSEQCKDLKCLWLCSSIQKIRAMQARHLSGCDVFSQLTFLCLHATGLLGNTLSTNQIHLHKTNAIVFMTCRAQKVQTISMLPPLILNWLVVNTNKYLLSVLIFLISTQQTQQKILCLLLHKATSVMEHISATNTYHPLFT